MILGPHGLRGAMRIRSYTARPESIAAYGPLTDEAGEKRLDLKVVGAGRNGLVMVQAKGVEDRDAAEVLAGTRLHIERSRLPELDEEDEYYQSDLIGLTVERPDGVEIGTVTGLYDFGAGDVIEFEGPDGRIMVPFTKLVVPLIDIANGRLVVDPPVEIEALAGEEAAGGGSGEDDDG